MSCADIRDEGYVYNPPSEDKGLVLRVALGCSHNACTFCGMYRNVVFASAIWRKSCRKSAKPRKISPT